MAHPPLEPGERVIATYPANRTQSSLRAVGGRLIVTNRRMMFVPRGLDTVTGGEPWQCPLEALTHVGVAPRGSNPFNGSMRRRLQVETMDAVNHFVVNRVAGIVETINQARTS